MIRPRLQRMHGVTLPELGIREGLADQFRGLFLVAPDNFLAGLLLPARVSLIEPPRIIPPDVSARLDDFLAPFVDGSLGPAPLPVNHLLAGSQQGVPDAGARMRDPLVEAADDVRALEFRQPGEFRQFFPGGLPPNRAADFVARQRQDVAFSGEEVENAWAAVVKPAFQRHPSGLAAFAQCREPDVLFLIGNDFVRHLHHGRFQHLRSPDQFHVAVVNLARHLHAVSGVGFLGRRVGPADVFRP